MVGAVKEICIFVIIAQAIMFFVPGNSYMKYVRILVGIMMILKMIEPVFGLFISEEKEQEIREQVLAFEQNMDLNSASLEIEDNGAGMYQRIEEELKNRLKECESGYEVLDVVISGDQKLIVTVARKDTETGRIGSIQIEPVMVGENTSKERESSTEKEEERLKELFGEWIGTDAGRIEIVFD